MVKNSHKLWNVNKNVKADIFKERLQKGRGDTAEEKNNHRDSSLFSLACIESYVILVSGIPGLLNR